MTTEEAIADIKAKVTDIDATLEMDFRNVVNCVKNGDRRIKGIKDGKIDVFGYDYDDVGESEIGIYHECVCSLQEAVDKIRAKLGARLALENVLKMQKEEEDGNA